jgi:lysophospholipase L1-like esterase
MRRLPTLLLALVATLMLAAPAAAVRPRAIYLALGDSLAVGDGASIPARTAYVPRLANYFSGTSHGATTDLVNLAVGGENTGSFIGGQLGPAMAAIGDPSTDVARVTLSIGGNDLGDLLSTPPCSTDPTGPACGFAVFTALSAVGANYPVILGSLQAALAADPGQEKVFVLTLWNVYGGTGSPLEAPVDFALLGSDLTVDCAANAVDPTRIGLNDLITCIGMALGAVVVDLYPVIGDDSLTFTHIGVGDIHPNDAGYALIASAHERADKAT